MDRIIVDDNASAIYALKLKERVDAIENGGIVDGEGNVVTVVADQKISSGTEIGGITIGETRTAFYAPAVEETRVVVTPLVDSGTKIANIKVNDTLHSIYSPTAADVVVTPIQQNGTQIATIKVGNNTQTIYAPEIISDGSGSSIDLSGKLDAPSTAGTAGQVLATNGSGTNYWTTISNGGGGSITVEGDGPMPLLKTITLNEDVSSVIISEDASGNALNLVDGFYIEAEFELATDNRARFFNVYLCGVDNPTVNDYIAVSSSHTLNTDRFTYADVYGKQIAPNRWLVEARTKNTMYEAASGTGLSVGQLAYSNYNAFNNPPTTIKSIMIGNNGGNYGRTTQIKIYGR